MRTTPHRGDPGEYLHPRRHGNNHRCRSEVHLHVHGQARGEHVVRPDDEADYTNRDHGIGHAQISEDRLAAEGGDDLAYDTKARKDHDVNFGVTEEPEQMLIKDRIATASRIRSEEHTSELQSLMRISYAVFCLKKKKTIKTKQKKTFILHTNTQLYTNNRRKTTITYKHNHTRTKRSTAHKYKESNKIINNT